MTYLSQLDLFPDFDENPDNKNAIRKSRSGTFTDNMKLPVHRWFKYSAGFSAEWVEEIIAKEKKTDKINILDPFAGSGTTLLAAESCGAKCAGFETHPFVHRIASIKLNWDTDSENLREKYKAVLDFAESSTPESELQANPLMKKCYSEENLFKLDNIKNAYLKLSDKNDRLWDIVWLGITGILRKCSSAGTAQWQYILPKKKKARVSDAYNAFRANMEQIVSDIKYVKYKNWKKTASIFLTDSRSPEFDLEEKFNLVITSPPYPNNYDYADATRLEMTFWGYIEGWKDLQSTVRQYLIRSCSQHSAAEKLTLSQILENEFVKPIYKDLSKACNELAEIRLTKGGRKTYHTMAAAYFFDLAKVFHSLRPICENGSRLCFVIGDSAPYGIYLAVDDWLGKLAIAAGFKKYHFEKIRDRNTKWKNRKHNVPLKEGRLWIEG